MTEWSVKIGVFTDCVEMKLLCGHHAEPTSEVRIAIIGFSHTYLGLACNNCETVQLI